MVTSVDVTAKPKQHKVKVKVCNNGATIQTGSARHFGHGVATDTSDLLVIDHEPDMSDASPISVNHLSKNTRVTSIAESLQFLPSVVLFFHFLPLFLDLS